ncbi:MAG: SPFH domain-containing protein, partial [Pseudomonadota bacterium]
MSFIAWIIIAVVLVAIFVVLAASFYTRATNEVALVKTGVGGRRVVIDGGTIAIPFFHEISRVNMQTLRMSVECRGEDSLITQDRLRVDVGAEFYVSVATTPEDVTKAAQTLGKRVFQADQLKSLLDGMLVDALRAEAAKVTLDALHENRGVFSANVKEALAEAASGYGLNVNAVSLVSLDQTPFAALDENNAFNAVGMRKLAEVIATSRKERAEINSSADVSVTQAEMEAHKRKLEIELEQRRAEIGQAQEVETLLAQQVAEIAERKAESERTKAHARITMEEAIQTAEIARERNLEIAERDRAIKLAAKSQEESKAETAAAVSRTEAVKAAEAVRTAEALDIAEREKSLALMAAEKEAQAAAARARISAESEKV